MERDIILFACFKAAYKDVQYVYTDDNEIVVVHDDPTNAYPSLEARISRENFEWSTLMRCALTGESRFVVDPPIW